MEAYLVERIGILRRWWGCGTSRNSVDFSATSSLIFESISRASSIRTSHTLTRWIGSSRRNRRRGGRRDRGDRGGGLPLPRLLLLLLLLLLLYCAGRVFSTWAVRILVRTKSNLFRRSWRLLMSLSRSMSSRTTRGWSPCTKNV